MTTLNSHADPTVWTGPNVTYTKSASTPADTIVAGKVVLKRGSSEVLFNTAAGEQFAGFNSPADTEWAFGTIANFASLTYQSMGSIRTTANNNLSAKLLNKDMVLHLINEDIYLSIKFTAWGRFGSGTVAYTRSTAGTVTPPSPTVSITSPANGAAFTAPADVPISADATVSSGTVTNVSFFNGTTLLGSVQSSPFNFTATGLQTGAYSLTAVATAAGISSTSAIVAVTVISTSSVQLTAPAVTNGVFSFSYSANPGLSYVVAGSFDLFNWQPLATNVASGNSVLFSEPVGTNSSRFYRVGRVSGP